jgi:hypothetical protein
MVGKPKTKQPIDLAGLFLRLRQTITPAGSFVFGKE